MDSVCILSLPYIVIFGRTAIAILLISYTLLYEKPSIEFWRTAQPEYHRKRKKPFRCSLPSRRRHFSHRLQQRRRQTNQARIIDNRTLGRYLLDNDTTLENDMQIYDDQKISLAMSLCMIVLEEIK